MKDFFKVSHDGGYDIKIIIANSKYEALGYYCMEVFKEEKDIYIESIDEIEEMPPNHNVEVSCIGFPIYKTLEELYKEKELRGTPAVICGLVE